jgi:hypothetical protein
MRRAAPAAALCLLLAAGAFAQEAAAQEAARPQRLHRGRAGAVEFRRRRYGVIPKEE